MNYDPNNIFAKILRGEAPCVKLYEDEHALAFLDIMPRATGHTLVIPKYPVRNLLDMTPAALVAFIPSVQKLAQAVKVGLCAEGISLVQYNEAASGQVVYHLHFHIIPHFEQDHSLAGVAVPASVLEPVAVKIREALSLM